MNSSMISAAALIFAASAVHAQLTWDVVPGDGSITHSNGVWDVATANWTPDGGANNSAWVSASEAVFDSNTNNSQIVIDVDASVEVGDLTLTTANGGGNVIMRGLVDNTQMTIAPGGATWDLGGRYLETLNNTSQDLFLSMTAGDTLTITNSAGTGGTFDTGEKPTGAAWVVNDCTLDFQAANGVLKGNAASVGLFDTVKLADGSIYVHDRNGNQGYVNEWDIGTNTVTFKNRWANNGNVTINGDITGTGTIVINCNTTRFWKPNNTNNTFAGKYIIGQDNIVGSELQNYAGDLAFGPVPASFVPDYFTLKNSGELKLQGIEIHANRGITLDGIGVIVNNGDKTVYGGTITGDGQLQVGVNNTSDGNRLLLTSNTHDYTGGTRIWQGSIELGIDDALPNDGLLTIGGGSKNGRLFMAGFDQTIGGLNLGGGNTKEVVNNSTTNSTLTINVASGKDYSYNANFNGTGEIHIVKDGPGNQRIQKTGFTTPPASLTVNEGFLAWNSNPGPTGQTTVNSGGTLGGIGTFTSAVTVNSGAIVAPGNPGGDNSLRFEGGLDLTGMIDDNAGGLDFSFGGFYDKIVVTNSSGTAVCDFTGSGFFHLGFSDFTFTDKIGLTNQVVELIVADTLNGTLDPTDLTGPVGDKGATGTLSLSGSSIILTVVGGDYSPYGEWALEYGLGTGTELDDTDGDSYDNLSEYAFGGNPTNAADIGNAPVGGEAEQGGTNYLTVVYGVQNSDSNIVAYSEKTDNLVIGSWTGDGVVELGTSSTNGFDYVTNGIPLGGDVVEFLGVFVEKD